MSESTPAPTVKPVFRRRLWRLAAVLAVLLAVAVLSLPWAVRQAIGPLRLKTLVEDALSDALHRKVTIAGEVSVIVVPWFGLAVGPLAVADAPGFGPTPMLAVARTEVTVRILPLLAGVVKTGSVRARGLVLHLRRDATGRTNWDELAAAPDETAAPAPGWDVAPQPRDIRISDATVSYEDAALGRKWTFSNVHLATGRGQPFTFLLGFRAEGPVPGASLDCRAQGEALPDPDGGLPLPRQMHLDSVLRFPGPLVPGGAFPLSIE